MKQYAILCNPGHNRVYFETSLKLSVSEFIVVMQKFSIKFEDVRQENIDGIDYLTFQTTKELSQSDIKIISDLSFVYAFFEIKKIDDELYLKPIKKIKEDFVDESISTILKYTGKTNEIFTRMMINIAFYSQSNNKNIRLLDPIAGKGTTLYEGLIKGYNVYGIEIGNSIVNESYHFIKRFLETAKYKYGYSSAKISGPNKSFTALKHIFETAKTKEEFKSKNTKTIELIAGNSLYVDKYYKKNFFDIIVGDLPYGVQHGNVTNEKQSSLTRNPTELLNACLPSWLAVLKPNGAIVLAWNSNVLPRKKMGQLFEEQGLVVKNDDVYLQFEHRVDQSISRDIMVAVKDKK
jgi:DNA modification methylase